MRRITKKIKIANIEIGGNSPIVVQTMTKLPISDVKGNIEQIEKSKEKGCEIIRVAVPEIDDLKFFREIVKHSPLPVIADVHFHWKIAVEAFRAGAACVRLNPGNFGTRENIKNVILAAKDYGGCIRVGVNSGSLDKKIEKKEEEPSRAIVLSALEFLKFFEDNDFFDIKVSLKSSSIDDTIKAYEMFSDISDYPLHIGLTEAGPVPEGIVKSSIALGYLLRKGIGDTIRVSLTAPPDVEVEVAWEILQATWARRRFPDIVSCPLCGRATYNFENTIKEVLSELKKIKAPIKVAIMGCEVNGPGEARDAHVGIAFSKGSAIVFKYGEIVKKGKPDEMVKMFFNEVRKEEKSFNSKS